MRALPFIAGAVAVGFAIFSRSAVAEDNQGGTNFFVDRGNQKLSASEIAGYAANAGFSGEDLSIAVAVALAESNGNTQAYNPETLVKTPDGLGSVGLWQIYRNAHPEFDNLDLTNPAVNAAAAFSVYQNAGNSFSPWTTFTHGLYLSYLGVAHSATVSV